MARQARLVEPMAGKEQFAALLDEQCRRLGLVDGHGQPDRRALAVRCGLSPTTLVHVIARPGRPSAKTLMALEDVTGVVASRWLDALAPGEGPEVDEARLTAQERALLHFARQRGDAWIRRTLAWFETLGEAGAGRGDSDRGGRPST